MARQHGGSSVGDHYAAVARQLGKPQLKPPPLPPAATHLWETFIDLARRRGGNGFDPMPITHTEIDAWQRLKQWPLAPWEVDAIAALDDAYFASLADKT